MFVRLGAGEKQEQPKRPSGNSDAPRPWPEPDWSLLDDRRGELPEFRPMFYRPLVTNGLTAQRMALG